MERDNQFLVKEIMKINNIASALQSANFNYRLEIERLQKELAQYKKQEGQIEEIMELQAKQIKNGE